MTEEQAAGFRANIWLPGQYPVWTTSSRRKLPSFWKQNRSRVR